MAPREYELVNASAADEIELQEERLDEHGGWSPQGQGTAATPKNNLRIDSVCNSGFECCFLWR
jgi:hypothetical protein